METIKRWLFALPMATNAMRRVRPLAYWARPVPHEADFLALIDGRIGDGLMLDLGANLGQSAISALKVNPGLRVLSFEPNPACEPGLRTTRSLLRGRMDYRLAGIGAANADLEFHVPQRSNRLLLEEGAFDPGALDGSASVARLGRRGRDYEIVVMRLPVITVDSLALDPVLVKMDLQGFELPALWGMQATLKRCRPALMIEIGLGHAEVQSFLSERGYVEYRAEADTLVAGAAAVGQLNAWFLAK